MSHRGKYNLDSFYPRDSQMLRHSERRLRQRDADREIREQSADLYNRLTDCPACGENVHALDSNDHSDC